MRCAVAGATAFAWVRGGDGRAASVPDSLFLRGRPAWAKRDRGGVRRINGPMAIVILGGLATSMLLNLLIVPTLAMPFGRFGPAPADAK